MSKRTLTVGLMSAIVVIGGTTAIGQTTVNTATPVPFTGLSINKLGQPNAPSAQGSLMCSGSSNTYAVTALDVAGGSSMESTSSISVACTPGTSAQYVMVTTPVVPGAATCNVFRTTGATTGYIGNVLCGAMFLDTGQTGTMLPGVPSTDQTGGINAPGMVNAQAFNATGAGAGTEILNSGSALGFCPSSSASCIPSTGAFFQQPGYPITGSWGISWPTGLPTSVPGDTYFGPLLFSQVVSSTNASTLSFSVLSDPNNNTLATASSASHAFTNGDLASISLSSTGADFVDSTIAVSNVVTSAASLASNQAVNGSGSQGLATGFTNTAGTITSGDLAAYTASGQVGNCTSLPCNPIIGVFNSSTPPTWIASGETAVNLDGTVNVAYNDILCASATVAGTAHDNGSIACTTGEWVGIVKTTALGVTSATAFVALR